MVKNLVKATPTQELKQKFKDLKSELKKLKCIKIKDFEAFVCGKEVEFESPEGWAKIRSCWYGYSASLRLTELMEEMLNEVKK